MSDEWKAGIPGTRLVVEVVGDAWINDHGWPTWQYFPSETVWAAHIVTSTDKKFILLSTNPENVKPKPIESGLLVIESIDNPANGCSYDDTLFWKICETL